MTRPRPEIAAPRGRIMARKPVLVGTEGHVEGEEMVLDYGKTVVVGRSRSADFSLRRIPEVLELSDEERQGDHDLRTVSGKHFEITPFSEDSIEIVNLSPNGTYVDGKRIDKVVIEDIAEETHEIKVGAREILQLELRDVEDEDENEPSDDGGDRKEDARDEGDADAGGEDAGGDDPGSPEEQSQ
jgi:hypothetical protein